MKTLVDTSVWSAALRKKDPVTDSQLSSLIRSNQILMIGVIRQELLSGIRHEIQFRLLKEKLSHFPDQSILTHHFELAAECYNACRTGGIPASHIDFLITAFCLHENINPLTRDRDFGNIAQITGLKLFSE